MKHRLYIYILISFSKLIFSEFQCQENHLLITSISENERNILNKISYNKKHNDSITLKNEISKIQRQIKKQGYFLSSFDSISKSNNIYTAFFSLNQKIKEARLNKNSNKSKEPSKADTLNISINNLEETLKEYLEKLEITGRSFSKVKLNNIIVKQNILYADLNLIESEKRTVNEIIVKGYDQFPKKYLKKYFKIEKNSVFNKSKLKQISDYSKNLDFIKESKAPEVLFTNDSTFIYLYFEKKSNSSVDAFINFTSNESGDLQLIGNIDLKLQNALNNGETFRLFWNSIGNERQEFRISSSIPYIFNSKISPDIAFSIYRQDSSFTNTKFESNFNYNLNSKLKLGLSFNSESSENLQENNSNVSSYKNIFFGLNLNYSLLNQDIFKNYKFLLHVNPEFGNRKTDYSRSNQFKINSTISYLWEFNQRNYLYTRNQTGFLNSDDYLNNELYRIGGANSVRGFNEQSIFTKSFSYFNIEYRFLTSSKSYLYSITDFGFTKITDNILGLGLGYLFINNKSKINLNISVGKTGEESFNINNLKLGISWLNYF